MKRAGRISIALIAAIMFTGCGGQGQPQQQDQATQVQGEQTADSDALQNTAESEAAKVSNTEFVEAIGECLEARWAITDPYNAAGEAIPNEEFRRAINIEIDAVLPYEEAEFEDENMAAAAEEYIAAMKECQGILNYIGTDQWQAQYDQKVFRKRVAGLYKINSIEPIPVDPSNQSSLAGLLSEGETTEAVWDIMDSVHFEVESEEYSFKKYSAVVENASNITFSNFSIDVSLIDADGVVVDTVTCWTDNWAAGTKHRLEFSTDKEFETIEIPTASWSV